MRLIDADKLKEKFVYTKELRDQYDMMPPAFHEMMKNVCAIILDEIDNTPTIPIDPESIAYHTALEDLKQRFDNFLEEETK